MKLYVGNFSFDTTERSLRELFEPFGTVTEVKLITDRETGEPRGFGFVTMGNVAEGNAAIKGLDGKDKGGRSLKVNEARPKDDRGGGGRPGGRPFPGSRR
jgi:RNA recognition motif-containing protein